MVCARFEPAAETVDCSVGVQVADPAGPLSGPANDDHVGVTAHVKAIDDPEFAAADAGRIVQDLKMG